MMSKPKIILQGGGDHAKVVLDCLLDLATTVVGVYDPKFTGELFGVPQLGQYNAEAFPDAHAVIAIGDNSTRKRVATLTRHAFTRVVHPSATISSRATVADGAMILHKAIIQANSKIGHHAIINTGAQVDHDCDIGDYVHIGPGTVLCGTVTVGEGTFVGAGSVVIPGVKIGKWSVIGAGSVVVRDIPDYCVALGNPARVTKQLR